MTVNKINIQLIYEVNNNLIPGVNYDPETRELFDDTILEEWEEEIE